VASVAVDVTSGGLVGRDAEVEALDRLLRDVRRRGAAVLVRGEAGIGKSALLRHAADTAAERGLRVLRTTGVESEAAFPFAGLHQLVRSLLDRLPSLPTPQRRALEAAFGMTEAGAPEPFLVGLAALNLLSDSAADQPLLLVVDDAHWLDEPSAAVLGFVARRLESEEVVVLAAQRDGFPPVLSGPAVEEHHLERLDAGSAADVLARRAPQLDPVDQGRLLAVAAGNPLALVELPLENARDDCAPVTLTARLEHAFADRLPGLPEVTRELLLVAALEDEGAVGESLAATCALRGEDVTAEAWSPPTAGSWTSVTRWSATRSGSGPPWPNGSARTWPGRGRCPSATGRSGTGPLLRTRRTTRWPPSSRRPVPAPSAAAAWRWHRRRSSVQPGSARTLPSGSGATCGRPSWPSSGAAPTSSTASWPRRPASTSPPGSGPG
jgi:hypothetical protein